MVKELLLELDELKKVAREVEEENEKLRSQLTEAYNVHCEAATVQNQPSHPKEDTVLMRMYNEGFHICNVKFAQVRNGECLFCMGLLRRQEDGEGGK